MTVLAETMMSDVPGGTESSLLSAKDITVSFGGVTALSGMNMEISRGKIVGLIGPNGAGKSTFLSVLSGIRRPDRGVVHFNGRDISHLAPHLRARIGLGRTFQQPELFGEMTTREHFVLAYRAINEPSRLISDLYTGRGLAAPKPEETERVDGLIDLLSLGPIAHTKVLGLPLGASRLVEVGRALAMRPQLVLLDEPSSGLDRAETEQLTIALARIVAEEGVSLVLVEHDVEMVLGLSDHLYVLDFGIPIAEGTSEEIRKSPIVRKAYLGEEEQSTIHTPRRSPSSISDVELLRVENLSVSYGAAQALSGISLTVAQGEALAILGANGAGKSTLSRAISGLVPSTSGSIYFDGEDITKIPAFRIRRLGIAYLPEGRGIFPGLTVMDNLKMAAQNVPRNERSAALKRALEMFPVLGDRRQQIAASLSGGEQQMLSLARALSVGPKLIIADELSLGLAPKIIDDVFTGLGIARKEGLSVLVIEQFVHRALTFCDRACILRRGEVVWEGPSDLGSEAVVQNYIGAQD